MDASAHDRDACVAAIFRASDLTAHVDPNAGFPRSGLLASRLQRTRRDDAAIPCDRCGISGCATRTILGQRPG